MRALLAQLASIPGQTQTNAERAAAALEQATPDDWTRAATFAWGTRDLLAMARNAVHEGYHHLRDIEKVLQQVRGRVDN